MPPVGVVIPAYRAEATVDAALASVAAQTLAPAQVVVVDDGSDDGTADAARRWSDKLPLTVLTQPNAGPAAARRRAMASLTTPLVALLDADDVWLPHHLASLTQVVTRAGTGECIASANAQSWRPDGSVSGRTWQERYPVPAPGRQRRGILRRNFVFVGALFSRDAAESVGGFRDGFSGAEDWDLWIRMIRAGATVHASPVPTVLYRTTPDSLTAGSGILDVYVAVMVRAREETANQEEIRVIDERLRWYQARRHLAQAYAAAERGLGRAARSEALRAARGSASMAIQAAGLIAAPAHTARLGARLRADRR